MDVDAQVMPSWPSEFFALANVLLVTLGPDGHVLHINPEGARTLDRPVDEIVGRDWFQSFIPERFRTEVRRLFERIIAEQLVAPETYENPVLRRDGSERIIAWRNAVPRAQTTGRIAAVISCGEDVTELRRAETERRDSEARFRATFEQAAVGMAHVGFDGRFLRINETLCAITGYDRQELEGLTFAEITHPDDVETDLALAAALRAGEIPHYRLEKRYIRKDGSTVWIALTGSLVTDASGVPQHFLAVVENITARRAAEALRHNEELQRLALSAAEAGAWQWDARTGAMDWSPEVFRIFGLPRAEAAPTLQEFLQRFVHPDDHAGLDRVFGLSAIAIDEAFNLDFRATMPGVGMRWMNSTGRIVLDDAGRPAGAFGLFADVTRRHEIEATLRESEARLRLAMMAGEIGAWDWNLVDGAVNWSSTFRARLGSAAAEAPKLDEILEHVHPQDRESVRTAFEHALAGDGDYGVDFRLLGDDGEVTWIRSHGAIERDASGAPVRMIGVDMNITADKRREEELRRLALELDHRTKNAVSVVRSIVSQTLSPGPERSTLLARLSALLRAHAMAARGGATKLDELARNTLAPYGPDRVLVDGPAVTLSSRATTAIAMVLHELATNAAKYGALSSEAGRLTVTWALDTAGAESPSVRLDWEEVAGGEVPAPGPSGFGWTVVKGTLESLGGVADIVHAPTGLRVRLSAPLASLSEPADGGRRAP